MSQVPMAGPGATVQGTGSDGAKGQKGEIGPKVILVQGARGTKGDVDRKVQ